jgi:phosphohistidine phosphatase
MKNLILIRHAKSTWEFPIQDFDRDLTQKGIENSQKIAQHTSQLIQPSSIIWSSAAKRTLETAKIVVGNWKLPIEKIEIKRELYTFDGIKLEQIVKSCPNAIDNLILFGHNNAITDFVNKFGDIFIDNVPTSGFVSITFDTNDWSTIDKGKIEKIIFPRDI